MKRVGRVYSYATGVIGSLGVVGLPACDCLVTWVLASASSRGLAGTGRDQSDAAWASDPESSNQLPSHTQGRRMTPSGLLLAFVNKVCLCMKELGASRRILRVAILRRSRRDVSVPPSQSDPPVRFTDRAQIMAQVSKNRQRWDQMSDTRAATPITSPSRPLVAGPASRSSLRLCAVPTDQPRTGSDLPVER